MKSVLRVTVTGAASAQMLLRVVNIFAQRGLAPDGLAAITRGEAMTIRLRVAQSCDIDADAVAEKLRAIIGVASVAVERRHPASDGVEKRTADSC